jgi:hypothetical protein
MINIMSELRILEIKNARDSEESPLNMEQVYASLGGGGHVGIFEMIRSLVIPQKIHQFVSFELLSVNTLLHFLVVVPDEYRQYVESQLISQYPKLLVQEISDYAHHFLSLPHTIGQIVLRSPYYVPIKTYKDVKDVDLLSGVVGQLAKLTSDHAAALQIRIESAGHAWQDSCASIISKGIPDTQSIQGRTKSHPQARLIEQKMAQVGFKTTIRILAASKTEELSKSSAHMLSNTFHVFTLGEGNGFVMKQPFFWQKEKLDHAYVTRSTYLTPRYQVLGSSELATLWHPPALGLSQIKNISWGATLSGEAPENLPIATGNEEEQKLVNFFARTDYKNASTVFGIKKEDRRKHLYIIGKTGSGKSTLIANMAINDMRNGEGMGIIDPHGDLSDILLDYIPSHRINDVAYLDPADFEYPFRLNPLEVTNEAYMDIVASGIVSIFHKLYQNSWGPRLEYILRNTLLTLLRVPNSTLLQVPELLADESYRRRIVGTLNDKVLKNFWLNEFEKMSEKLRIEAISPILNKVGQFLSSKTMRNILGSHKSTVDLSKMMDEGKVVIVNLSQGKLGEDNSALMGAMIITKMQLAAMNRVYQEEATRRDFYLYVDEFQNFATTAFIKILSEARKYHLNLTLANQYIGQIDEDVQNAIFGNVGSLISFGVGAQDARLLGREFGNVYQEEELVHLGNYETVNKLSIDNHTSRPFSARTLPLPHSKNQNREKVIRSSRERYAKPIERQ